ncbi:MAG: DNA polymerase III subunit delta' [Acidobacteria bacterium]|nr:MAG: DNA polymerase III subunit delta' [Acidobacteriota bacterium]
MGFDSFLGNARAVQSVRDMLGRDRVPGSLLFAGPEGVGKKTLALMLAKALNCERRGPGHNDFCGECSHCRKADEFIAIGTEDLARRRDIKDAQKRTEGLVYLDLQLIEPITRYILIEQIRQLRATAYTRPFTFRQRVMIVDQAHAIHWQAADLLLKVLEEPPETTIIILICPNAYELRPTIRSRCQVLQFVRVETAVIERVLKEERRTGKNDLALAVRVANGSIAAARSLDLNAYVEKRKSWLTLLDSVARPSSRSLAPAQWKTLFDATKQLADDRDHVEESLKIGSILLRDVMHALVGEESSTLTNIDLLPRLKAWAQALGLEGIRKLEEGLERAHSLQNRNVNQQLTYDSLSVEVLSSLHRG